MTTTIGQLWTKSAAAGEIPRAGHEPSVTFEDFDVKTLFTTSAGFTPQTSGRDGTVVPIASRTPSLLDLLLATPTNSSPFPYMEETTETNAAAEVAEAGTYPEATFAFTPRAAVVGKVSVWVPATDEVLEDSPEAGRTLDDRLPFLLRQRLEAQIVSGNGTAPNLRGLLNVVGIQTQALGADSRPVAIRKAITKVGVPGYAVPNAIVLNPTDAEDIDLAAAVDLLAPFMDTTNLWNLPRVHTDAMTLGTALVGDFVNFCALKVRRGITLTATNSHGTYFTEGKQAIRADIRVAFPVYRPAAFCTITGI